MILVKSKQRVADHGEVFTPPEFANRMLDTLAEAWAFNHDGANLWADKTVKFLDPCAKSGITKREQPYIESQVREMNLEGDDDE